MYIQNTPWPFLILCVGLMVSLDVIAQELDYQPVTSDATFEYRFAYFKMVAGKWHGRWQLHNRTAVPLRVGSLKARYDCPEGPVQKTHYFSTTLAEGIAKAHISDPICQQGPPKNPTLLDVDYRDPNGSSLVLKCTGATTTSDLDRRYRIDSRLLEKGIAKVIFRDGATYTYRIITQDKSTTAKPTSEQHPETSGRWEDSMEAKMFADRCGEQHPEPTTAYNLLKNMIKKSVQERSRELKALCRKQKDDATCKAAEKLGKMTPIGTRS